MDEQETARLSAAIAASRAKAAEQLRVNPDSDLAKHVMQVADVHDRLLDLHANWRQQKHDAMGEQLSAANYPDIQNAIRNFGVLELILDFIASAYPVQDNTDE